MAIRRSDKVKAAFFLMVTAVLFVAMMLFLLGTNWMKKQECYYIDFDNLTKLNTGTPVRYSGLNIGKVTHIPRLTNDTVRAGSVTRVTIEVVQNTRIYEDCVASIEIDSIIVGNQYILIVPGHPGSRRIPANSQEERKENNIIKSDLSNMDKVKDRITVMSGEGTVLLSNLNLSFNSENAEKLASILSQVDKFLSSNTVQASATINEFRDGMKTVKTAIDSAQIQLTMCEFRTTMVQACIMMANIDKAVRSANEMFSMNQKAINDTLKNLRTATDAFNDLLDEVRRQPGVIVRGKEHENEENQK